MRLDGYRARQSLVGLSAHCANSYIPHMQHIIQYVCAVGCVGISTCSVHSIQHACGVGAGNRVRIFSVEDCWSLESFRDGGLRETVEGVLWATSRGL